MFGSNIIRSLSKVCLIILVAIFILIPLAVQADSGKKVYKVNLPVGGKVTLSKDVQAEFLGYDAVSGKPKWKSVIEAPITVDNAGHIPIVCRWDVCCGGNKFSTAANLFYAEVSGETVTMNKGQTTWTPTIQLNSKGRIMTAKLTGQPYIINDYINAYYQGNILRFTYMFDNLYTFYRDLRIIEGVLLEYYKFDFDPQGDITISNKINGDTSHFGSVSAWDADHKSVKVAAFGNGKRVQAADFQYAKYPVIIDPTSTYYTSASDGYLRAYNLGTWAAARAIAIATDGTDAATANYLGQDCTGNRVVMRTYLYFDTSDLPDDATITTSVLSLYIPAWGDGSTQDFNIVIQSGMSTYPHDPLVLADYNRTLYSSDGGSFNSAGIVTSAYNAITMNATGRGWINKTGYTKFCLRGDDDINDIDPLDCQNIAAYSYEQGAGFRPKLEVTYTAIAPSVTTAAATSVSCNTTTFNGEITNLGGDTVNIRGFIYGATSNTTTPSSGQIPPAGYTANTSETSGAGFAVGAFQGAITGLTKGTTYYFRAYANNSGGYGYGSETSMTCLGDPIITAQTPSSITATTARLQSTLSNGGGTTNQVRWGYGTTDNGTDIAAYTTVTGYAGSYSQGDYPYLDISGLTASTVYYFAVQAQNTCGTSTASNSTFTTGTGIDCPTNIIAVAGDDNIVLSWIKSSTTPKTIIRYNVNSCPSSNTTGLSLYSGTASNYEHTGLTSGTTYCYMFWGYDDTLGYSSGNYTISATCLAVTGTDETIPTTGDPAGYTLTPSKTAFETTNPLVPIIDANANVLGINSGFVYFAIAMLICTAIAFAVYRFTGKVGYALVAICIAMTYGTFAGVIPGFVLLFLVVITIAGIMLENRSVA